MRDRVIELCVSCILLMLLAALPAAAESHAGLDALREFHGKVRHLLEDSSPENPFYLHADARKHVESGDAAFYLPESFVDMADALIDVTSWCDILPLHINVKGCLYEADAEPEVLTLFVGHKGYQAIDDAHRIDYEFSSVASDGYFEVRLFADEGPMGTSDYRIEFEAMSVGDKTFARLRTSEHQSWLSSKAMQVYLSTKGKDKRGISVVGYDDEGRPQYSAGEQGAIERNVLRYYFALIAFFDSTGTSADEPFELALDYWFAATEQYPQLHGLKRAEYLSIKRRERANQLALQP